MKNDLHNRHGISRNLRVIFISTLIIVLLIINTACGSYSADVKYDMTNEVVDKILKAAGINEEAAKMIKKAAEDIIADSEKNTVINIADIISAVALTVLSIIISILAYKQDNYSNMPALALMAINGFRIKDKKLISFTNGETEEEQDNIVERELERQYYNKIIADKDILKKFLWSYVNKIDTKQRRRSKINNYLINSNSKSTGDIKSMEL